MSICKSYLCKMHRFTNAINSFLFTETAYLTQTYHWLTGQLYSPNHPRQFRRTPDSFRGSIPGNWRHRFRFRRPSSHHSTFIPASAEATGSARPRSRRFIGRSLTSDPASTRFTRIRVPIRDVNSAHRKWIPLKRTIWRKKMKNIRTN